MPKRIRSTEAKPRLYDDAVVARIIEGLELGQTLGTICAAKDLPAKSTVKGWIQTIPDFAERVAQARKCAATFIAEDALDIADSVKNPRMVNRARLQVDTRKWLAGVYDPQRFGDRKFIQSEITQRQAFNFRGLSDAQRELILALLQSVENAPTIDGDTVDNALPDAAQS